MPITASFGALSYPRSGGINSNWEYWYLETNSNANFNGGTFDSTTTNFFIAGQDPSTNRALVLRVNENNSYPALAYNFDMFYASFPNSNVTSNFVDVGYSSLNSGNIILYGSYQSGNGFSGWQVPFSTANITAVPSTFDGYGANIYSYDSYLSPNVSLTKSSAYSISPSSSSNDWIVYRDNYRLVYRNLSRTRYNVSGPLTYVGCSTTSDAVPQNIMTDTTGNAVVALNLSTTTASDTLIRRVNKTSGGTPYPLYPTIWQRKYSFGIIYQTVLDTSNNIYFVSTDNTNSVVVQYDISGNLVWQRQINGVKLKGITYVSSSSRLYVCGTIVSNNNLFFASYDLSGNIQWQTKLSGAVFDGKRIKVTTNGAYVVGQAGSRGFTFKAPIDGTVPGDGTFTLNGTNYTYTVASQTETAASYTSTTPATTDTSLAYFCSSGNGVHYNNNGMTFSSVDTVA